MTITDSTVTIPLAEYEHLLQCTVGVVAYTAAARHEAREGEAQAAADRAVAAQIAKAIEGVDGR